MKKIINIRKKSNITAEEKPFLKGETDQIQNKIVNIINSNPSADYDFMIDENGEKYVANITQLSGEVVNIVDELFIAEIIEENGETMILISQNEGALPQQHTVDQLNKVRRMSKGTDIGDRIGDMNKQGANIQYIRNPIDSGIESYQDFQKKNKKFKVKRIKKFKI